MGADRSSQEPRSPQGNRALGAGMTLAVSVGLFAYGGHWLDQQFGTKPWFLLLLVLCGIVGGMLHMILTVAPEMWPFGKQTTKTVDAPVEPGASKKSDEPVDP